MMLVGTHRWGTFVPPSLRLAMEMQEQELKDLALDALTPVQSGGELWPLSAATVLPTSCDASIMTADLESKHQVGLLLGEVGQFVPGGGLTTQMIVNYIRTLSGQAVLAGVVESHVMLESISCMVTTRTQPFQKGNYI